MDDREKKRRLFVGVQLDDASRAASAGVSEGLQRTGFAAKYEPAEKLHVTLAFLGNVGPSQYEAVAEALDRVANENAPFALTLDRIGAFPHEHKPRVIYIGAREQGAPLSDRGPQIQLWDVLIAQQVKLSQPAHEAGA